MWPAQIFQPAQHRVLVPEHQQLAVLRPVPAKHQHSQTERPAHQQADDLEQQLASQLSAHQHRRRRGQISNTNEFLGDTCCWRLDWGWPRAPIWYRSSAG